MSVILGQPQGPLRDGPSLSYASSLPLSNYEAMNGPPQNAPSFDPAQLVRRESYNLAQIYADKTHYFGITGSSMILTTANPDILTLAFPIHETPDVKFSYDIRLDDRTVAQRVSERTMGAPVTSSYRTIVVSLARYRLAVRSTIEALKTERGLLDANAGILNAFMSMRETMELAAYRYLMTANHEYAALAYAAGLRYEDMAAVLATETRLFGAVNKDERGLTWVAEEVKKTMAARNVVPNTMFVPEGMLSQVTHQLAMQEYYRAGAGSSDAVMRGADALGGRLADLDVIVTRAMFRSKTNVSYRPLDMEVVVGGFFKLEDQFLDRAYRTSDRSVFPFDADKGGGTFVEVALVEAITNCLRWDDSDEGFLVPAHGALAERMSSALADAHLTLANGYADPLMHRLADGSYKEVSVVGQLEEEALPDATLDAFTESVRAAILERLPVEDVVALRAGEAWTRRLYERQLTDADIAFMRAVTADAAVGADGIVAGNRFGAHDIVAAAIPAALGPSYEPAGYGWVGGMRTIGELAKLPAGAGARALVSAELVSVASAYSRALDNVSAVLRSLFTRAHPLFSGAIVPSYFRSSAAGVEGEQQDFVTAFAQNIIDFQKYPLYLPVAGGAAPAAFDALDADFYAAEGEDAINAVAIETLRAVLPGFATPEVRAAFATADGVRAFLRAYASSDFARAYAAREGSADVDDTRFGTFVLQALGGALGVDAGSSLSNVLTHVVRIVGRREQLPAGDITRIVEAWASVRTPATGLALNSSAAGFKLSRLVAPYTALRGASALGDGERAYMASPLDVSQRFTGDAAQVQAFLADSRIDITSSSLFSRSPLANASLALSSRKRTADDAFLRTYDAFGDAAVSSLVAPALASTVVDGRVRGVLDLNVQLVRRYRQASENERDVLRRASALLALLTPVTRKQLLLHARSNVRVPFDFIGMRPFERLTTQAIVVMQAKEGFGITAYRETRVERFVVGSNGGVAWNITSHFAPICFAHERYLVQPNVRIVGLKSGVGLKPFNAKTFSAAAPSSSASVIYALVGSRSMSGSGGTRSAFDIRGYYDADLTANLLTDEASRAHSSRPHYDSALFYSTLLSLPELVTSRAEDRDARRSAEGKYNTVVLQSKQYVVSDAAANGLRAVAPEDHLGDVQVGSAADFRGGLSTKVRVGTDMSLYTPK